MHMTNVKLPRRQVLHLGAGALGAGALALPALSRIAQAQIYPARPVRMVVAFAPGGQTDTIARVFAQQLSERLGKQFFVENVVGGGGAIGIGRTVQAARDGYTVLVIDTSFVLIPHLQAKVSFDPFKDFDPVSLAVTTTQVLTVTPSLPVQTVRDLVALVRANPGKYSYATPGIGTPGHMTAELFRVSLGLDLVNVPFTGAGPAIASTIGGHTPIAFGSPASTIPQVNEGKLRALGVATRARLPALPAVPTMAEAGFADIEGDFWVGLFVPAGTGGDIVALLNREIDNIVAQRAVQERLAALGFEPAGIRLADSAAKLASDDAKWSKVIRAAGLRAE
jgi:tripartite-type tricarboxylate transporter receptor subunit TctC